MNQSINDLLEQLKNVEHGFKHIISAGDTFLGEELNHFAVSLKLLNNESYQYRMLATYIMGQLSTENSDALRVLETQVAEDENWRVQEMLAKAFNHYCQKKGYENSLPKIQQWLSDKNPNVKRAVIEGLRIWTGRPYFKENPQVAIQLISKHRSEESEYLRKSVGNSLHDIRKKFPDLIQREIDSWDLTDKHTAYTKRIIEK